jgi:hypothetical protein
MKIIQFGKKDDKVDLRMTLFITGTNFIVVKGHVASLDSKTKEYYNSLITDLVSLENNKTYLTIKYLTENQKKQAFCISDLSAIDFGDEIDNEKVDSLEGLYNYLGKKFFTSQTTRTETLLEGLLSSSLSIVVSVLALIVIYVIWIDPSMMYEHHGGTALRAAKKNFAFNILSIIVDLVGSNIAGGLFLMVAGFGIYSTVKRISNKKTYLIYIK